MIANYQRLLSLYKKRMESMESIYKSHKQAVLVCEEQVQREQVELARLKLGRDQLVKCWQGGDAQWLDARNMVLSSFEIGAVDGQITQSENRGKVYLQRLREARQALDDQALVLRKQSRKCELLEDKIQALKIDKKRQRDRQQENAIEDRFGVTGLKR